MTDDTPLTYADLQPLLKRIQALEASAQGDEREWTDMAAKVVEQTARIEGLLARIQWLERKAGVAS